ncbi:MAG: hypothetical protein U5O16_22235 [Rhodococcus sp. (in: high G+C Gram-positive bacteria)]|uniref:hypothetical protein n=1 Tax=Rhodococcus sp. TaxID=1831 RepID=UPI002AD7DD89|nr:hypothetical protein [Rhodococcus sp. (in: high G+C Gram-positive bacteria)]
MCRAASTVISCIGHRNFVDREEPVPDARGSDCRIHGTAVIGRGVDIGDRVTIGPYAVLTGPSKFRCRYKCSTRAADGTSSARR